MGNGKLRRIVAVLGLLVFTSLYSPPTQTRAIEVVHLGTISPGERVDADPVFVPGPTGSWHYTFSVAGKGAALRVGIDLSQRDTCIFFSLFDPNGVEVEADWVDWPVVCPNDGTSQSFNADLTAFNPKPGFYTVQVHALDVDELAFRLRVVFETKAKTPRQLLPNLVPWTPWEFGYAAPDSANPGTANDTSNLPGDPTVSCHPEEEAGAIDCLRFSAGVYNIGDGPMFIAFRGDDAFQHVYTRDGTAGFYPDNEGRGRYTETPAGTGEFHEFHDHRHLANFVLYELLSVDNAERPPSGVNLTAF